MTPSILLLSPRCSDPVNRRPCPPHPILANNNFAKGEGYPSDGKNMPKSRDSEVLLCSITHSSFALEIENDLTSKSVTPLY